VQYRIPLVIPGRFPIPSHILRSQSCAPSRRPSTPRLTVFFHLPPSIPILPLQQPTLTLFFPLTRPTTVHVNTANLVLLSILDTMRYPNPPPLPRNTHPLQTRQPPASIPHQILKRSSITFLPRHTRRPIRIGGFRQGIRIVVSSYQPRIDVERPYGPPLRRCDDVGR
jgi:hypothetical protein